MNTVRSISSATSAYAVVALLAGCSGSSQFAPQSFSAEPSSLAGGVYQRVPSIAARAVAHLQPYRGKSWIDLNARTQRLLYLSYYDNSVVEIHTYPKGRHVGTLTGFSNPQGLCADPAGDVYVANTGAENVLEYAPGGASPIATYPIPGEYPVSCSIDPTTGNVAVGDIFSPTTGEGAVTICSSPSSCATDVEPGGLLECYFVGYDGSGNLFVDGETSSGFGMARKPHERSAFKSLTLHGSGFPGINFPGDVQWDGRRMSVGDQSVSVIYRFAGSTVVGSTTLDGTTDVVEYFIFGKDATRHIVAPYCSPSGNCSAVAAYRYPTGGNPGRIIRLRNGYQSPAGLVITQKP